MKAVIYHADGPIAEKYPAGLYKNLFQGFVDNAHSFNIDVVHLTINDHPSWGDQVFRIEASSENIVYNREIAWLEFLKQSDPNETYWLTEPDARINELWPPLDCDLALLIRRGDPVRITPSWRIARKSSVKFFEDIVEYFDNDNKIWHGDSTAFVRAWNSMGQPDIGRVNYKGINIDLRNYKEYSMTKSKFSRQFKADNKLKLLGL
jgi:hypothetical protein